MTRLQVVEEIVRKQRPPLHSPNPMQRPLLLYYPDLPGGHVFDPASFEWTYLLRQARSELTNELNLLIAGRCGFDPVFPDYADSGDWAAAWFKLYGQPYADNLARCPATSALLDELPRCAGWACHSAMSPGSHVQPHCGVTNAKLRLHFSLIADPGSRMRVGTETYEWSEGGILIFDDSYEHEVWIGGRAPRIVFIVDVYHPDLADEEVAFLQSLETEPTPLFPGGLRRRYRRIAAHSRLRGSKDLSWLYSPPVPRTPEVGPPPAAT